MGLKRFDNNLPTKKKSIKQIIMVLCICLVAVISVTSYAIFQVRHSKPIADAKVGKFKTSDIILEILIDGEKSETFPEKESDKVFNELTCTNGGEAQWDSEAWELSIINISGPTECTISFKIETPGTNAVEKLTELAESNTTEMFIDDTADANIRYMGSNPANYVDIGNGNDEDGNPILWRVIGVMNNIDDGTGAKETRLKIIRENSIGNIAWDSSNKNNWSTASLNTLLNNDYFNKQGSYTATGFQTNVESLVGDAVYHLGGPTSSNYKTLTASGYYNVERSNTVYSGNPTTWTGKVGLMYPSDYGYATSGGISKNKAACNAKELANWAVSIFADCKNNDWLFDSSYYQWTMTHDSSREYYAVGVTTSSNVSSSYGYGISVSQARVVRPVVYLKSDVKITDGEGTKENPYKIGM